MSIRKSPDEIRMMASAGRVVAEMHEVCRAARPGATTLDIDHAARAVLAAAAPIPTSSDTTVSRP